MDERLLLIVFGLVILVFIFILSRQSFFNSQEKSLLVDKTTRTYILHLPKEYDEKKVYPLVIMLHAFSDNPKQLEINTGMSAKADKERFAVVYPKGTNSKSDKRLSWNSGFCCGSALKKNIDDVSFIKTLIDELTKTYSVNKGKIYIAGFSNGAMMAYRLGAELSDKIAAIAVDAGSIGGIFENNPFGKIVKPKQPLSVLILHGQKDRVVLYDGGKNDKSEGNYLSVLESMDFWVKNLRCKDAASEEIIRNGLAVKKTYTNCQNNTQVTIYKIPNSGHVWFGGIQEIQKNIFHQSISATDAMWDFFKTKSK